MGLYGFVVNCHDQKSRDRSCRIFKTETRVCLSWTGMYDVSPEMTLLYILVFIIITPAEGTCIPSPSYLFGTPMVQGLASSEAVRLVYCISACVNVTALLYFAENSCQYTKTREKSFVRHYTGQGYQRLNFFLEVDRTLSITFVN